MHLDHCWWGHEDTTQLFYQDRLLLQMQWSNFHPVWVYQEKSVRRSVSNPSTEFSVPIFDLPTHDRTLSLSFGLFISLFVKQSTFDCYAYELLPKLSWEIVTNTVNLFLVCLFLWQRSLTTIVLLSDSASVMVSSLMNGWYNSLLSILRLPHPRPFPRIPLRLPFTTTCDWMIGCYFCWVWRVVQLCIFS